MQCRKSGPLCGLSAEPDGRGRIRDGTIALRTFATIHKYT